MIAEFSGVTYAKVPGDGWVELDRLTADQAMLVLGEIQRLIGRLEADAGTIRALARRKQAEAGRP